MHKIDCPKCSSDKAWYEKTHCDLILRCMCGYHKVVHSTLLNGMTVERNDSGADVKLPRKDTYLYSTLQVLRALSKATTSEVATSLRDLGNKFTDSDTANYLALLRAKGLVTAIILKRKQAGGSTWVLTEKCKTLLGE